MIRNLPKNAAAWVGYFEQVRLPIRRVTADRLAGMAADIDRISGRDISRVVLQDPLMTVNVLRYIQNSRRGNPRGSEITTIDHAVMMLGLMPFFRYFEAWPVLEERLAMQPEVLADVNVVFDRAHVAGELAFHWAVRRYDKEAEEVQVAALLHDLAEILLWLHAPDTMRRIRTLLREQRGLRSAVAQQEVLGFRMIELQLRLAAAWHLPRLLQSLMDDLHADTPRVRCVLLAVSLTRHLSNGWEDPALPDDFEQVGKLLGVSSAQAQELIRQLWQTLHDPDRHDDLPPP